jgi:hypothetical protein
MIMVTPLKILQIKEKERAELLLMGRQSQEEEMNQSEERQCKG